jgi:hypothetical protein
MKVITPPTCGGWLQFKLTDEAITKLDSYIEESEKNPVSVTGALAGNISDSNALIDTEDWFLKNVLYDCVVKYTETFPPNNEMKVAIDIMKTFDASKLKLNSFWVNYQKQHEFNPMHDHTGLFSFVIWKHMPVEWIDQLQAPNCKYSGSPCAGNFAFLYQDIFGNTHAYQYGISKELENTMLFFPSSLKHLVNPFYNSDEVRVSISGNLNFTT